MALDCGKRGSSQMDEMMASPSKRSRRMIISDEMMALDYACPSKRSRRMDEKTMILKELWPDILKRLPVKTLISLRCVCKSWNSLLSSAFFIGHHLSFTTKRISGSHLSYSFDNGPSCALLDQQDTNSTIFTPLQVPYKPQSSFDNGPSCLGVVHGVVCLSSSKSVALWNPAIRKHFDIPFPFASPSQYNTFVGFGFDSRKDDFKVVRILGDYYEVFSVRDWLWRRKPLPAHLRSLSNWQNTNCFVNGSIYWLTSSVGNSRHNPYGLLLFDCGEEEFSTMDLPKQVGEYVKAPTPRVFPWRGVITFLKFISDDIDHGSGICELWTMMHDTSRWSKLITSDAGEIITKNFKLKALLNNKGHFMFIDNPYKWDDYVFEESMLLMGHPKSL